MTDTPLYDVTLGDLLARARRDVQRADEAARQAQEEVRRVQHQAARQVAEAHARADAAVRLERVRVEEEVRRSLVDVPALPVLRGFDDDEVEAPPVPPMSDLLGPSPGVTRFLDALLGSSES